MDGVPRPGEPSMRDSADASVSRHVAIDPFAVANGIVHADKAGMLPAPVALAVEGPGKPALVNIPVDVLRCIVEFLDRNSLCSLKQTCRGFSRSPVLDEVMYKRSIRYRDLEDLRLTDWGHRSYGRQRWESFKRAIDDSNRKYVKRITMSHFSTLDDFKWVDANLPNLIGLDLSDIKDFLWSVDTTIVSYPAIWTWSDLVEACPNLFSRLRYLMLFNWTDFRSHSRIQYRYPLHEHGYSNIFRQSRRRKMGLSACNTVLKACTQLEVLAIRGSSYGCRYWSPWDVHQQVCLLSEGIAKNIPRSLKTIKIHQTTPYLSVLIDQLAAALPRGQVIGISIGFGKWVREDRREGSTYQTRMMTPTFRDETNSFDTQTYEGCECDHHATAQRLVDESCDTLGQILNHMSKTFVHKNRFNLTSHDSLKDVVLNPFQFINPYATHRARPQNPDILNSPNTREVLKWMKDSLSWHPTFGWDPLMFDSFPSNIANDLRLSPPKDDILAQITQTLRSLKEMGLPICLVMGDRTDYYIHAFGLQRHLFFGPTKVIEGDDDNRREVIRECNARFNLSHVAEIVDELIIEYPYDTPGIFDRYEHHRKLSEHEMQLMAREMAGWRKFWARYAHTLSNLKKLVVMVPRIVFDDWAKSKPLQALLNDGSWNLVADDSDVAKPRWFPCEFVKRTFFRAVNDKRDQGHVQPDDSYDPAQNESRDLTEDELADADKLDDSISRFWVPLANETSQKKRKAESDSDDSDADCHHVSTSGRPRKRVRSAALPFLAGPFTRLFDRDSDSDSD